MPQSNWADDGFGNLVFNECPLNWAAMYYWRPEFMYSKGML